MDFDWSKSFSEEVEGELPDIHIGSDKLDRGKYAEFLTDFLSSLDNQNYVMNLNAEWGAGKTYFLQRWYHTIKEDHPAVYIDAWKHDFSDEPLLAVISAITSYFKDKSPETGGQKAKELAARSWRFSKKIAPELVRGLTKKLSGVDISKLTGDDPINSASDVKLDRKETNGIEDFSLLAGKAFEVALADHSEKVDEMEFFKNSIKSWLEEVISKNENLNSPMFVFIDELDRCRPTYAIELLETVKHLFDIEGIVFVIATDTSQLQHSIKAVYGEGFESEKYLQRFFDRSFALKKVELQPYIEELKIFKSDITQRLRLSLDSLSEYKDDTKISECFAGIASFFQFDLRTTEQFIHQLYSCYTKKGSENNTYWLATALFIAIRKSNFEFYRKYFLDKQTLALATIDSLTDEKLYFDRTIPVHCNYVGLRSITEDVRSGYDYEQITGSHDGKPIPIIHGYRISELIKLLLTKLSETGASDAVRDSYHKNELGSESFVRLLSISRMKGSGEQADYIDLVEMASDLT